MISLEISKNTFVGFFLFVCLKKCLCETFENLESGNLSQVYQFCFSCHGNGCTLVVILLSDMVFAKKMIWDTMNIHHWHTTNSPVTRFDFQSVFDNTHIYS